MTFSEIEKTIAENNNQPLSVIKCVLGTLVISPGIKLALEEVPTMECYVEAAIRRFVAGDYNRDHANGEGQNIACEFALYPSPFGTGLSNGGIVVHADTHPMLGNHLGVFFYSKTTQIF